MTELDKKLDELSIWIEANRDVPPATWENEIRPLIKVKITQAFAAIKERDARESASDAWDCYMFADGLYKAIDDGWKDPIFIAADISRGRTGEMTGQEWYDKFKGELERHNCMHCTQPLNAMEAAKKAAGLPELREQS